MPGKKKHLHLRPLLLAFAMILAAGALPLVIGSGASAGDRPAVKAARIERALNNMAAPGGELNPLLIPKYVTPLVIPPVMDTDADSDGDSDADSDGDSDNYDISVREFRQQILPGGIWNTVISYAGEITTVRAKFDIAGLYVWHCHIVEHEDNEMMRPYVVSP